MSFHLAAFSSSVAASTLATVSALSDQILSISDNKFNLQRQWDILAAVALGTDLQRARFNAPSLRGINLPWIRPLNDGGSIPTDPAVADYRDNPFRLRPSEQFSVDAYQDNVGAQEVTVLTVLSSLTQPAPRGNVHTLRGTNATATTAQAWSDGTITWEDSLESGMYAVVGGVAISATGIAFRLINQEQTDRPGGLCVGDVNERTHDIFRMGGLGKWMEFDSDTLPNVQFLTDAAETPSEIYLDIVKVG